MRNFRQTILSQYQSSPRLVSLLAAIESWLSPDDNYENFFQTVWNIETASGYGLDVLGRIVNVPRTVTLSTVPTFGFGEAGDRVGFGQGPFYEAILGLSDNFVLTDDVYRQLILAKAAFNITDGSTQAINAILMNILFPNRGNAYVVDGRNVGPQSFGFGEAGDRVGFGQGPFGDRIFEALPGNMTLTYVFEFPLQAYEEAIVLSGVLPKPTGVTPFWSFTDAFVALPESHDISASFDGAGGLSNSMKSTQAISAAYSGTGKLASKTS